MAQAYLLCDNPACGIRHPVPKITKEMIGLACSKCGSDLLTQEDYDLYESVIAPAIEIIEYLNKAIDPKGEMSRKTINLHGRNGKVTVQ